MQRWPLKDSAPVTHSRTARSRSASARTMAGFLASRPRTQRRRFGRGCCCFSTFATRERADERERGDVARLHERAGHGAPVAVDDVDDAAAGRRRRRPQQRGLAEHAVPRQLDHDGVAHDQRRDQRRERLVQRIVERAHAEHHAERRAADLGEDARVRREAAGRAVDLLQRLDRVARCTATVRSNSFSRVGAALADLPHEEAHRLLAHRAMPATKARTASTRAPTRMVGHGPRPWSHARTAASSAESASSRVSAACGPMRPALDPAVHRDAHRRGDLARRARPAPHLAVHEVKRAVRVDAPAGGEVGRGGHVQEAGDERVESGADVGRGHGASGPGGADWQDISAGPRVSRVRGSRRGRGTPRRRGSG